MVMWFGFDWQSKAAVVVVMTFFPMLVNTVAGLAAAGSMERERRMPQSERGVSGAREARGARSGGSFGAGSGQMPFRSRYQATKRSRPSATVVEGA